MLAFSFDALKVFRVLKLTLKAKDLSKIKFSFGGTEFKDISGVN